MVPHVAPPWPLLGRVTLGVVTQPRSDGRFLRLAPNEARLVLVFSRRSV